MRWVGALRVIDPSTNKDPIWGAGNLPEDAIERARSNDIAIESAARMLLNCYGVVFRDLLGLESNIPSWGVLLHMLLRLEDREEVRGGRFVSGFSGEQFALPEVLDSLRVTRNQELSDEIAVAGADPLNLVVILLPGERVPAMPGRNFALTNESFADPAPRASQNLESSRTRQFQRRQSLQRNIQKADLFGMPMKD